jgi:hypothetical protein
LSDTNTVKAADSTVMFSTQVAEEYGLEIAILYNFFQHHFWMTSNGEEKISAYPTIAVCCSFFPFWDEEKIRELTLKLYTYKLI